MGSSMLDGLSMLGGGFVGYIIPFLFVLTIVVFFHELGHFLVARWCGVKVLVFSIGFGPEIVGFNDRKGTRWKISAIPLGGYVKFFGDDTAASTPDPEAIAAMAPAERRQSFHHQPVAGRAAIVAAGPIANFLLAIVIFAGIFMFYGKQNTTPRVDAVQPDSVAAAAGFKPGDLVVSINGQKIDNFTDMQRLVSISAGQTLAVEIERDGKRQVLTAVPALQERKDNFGNTLRLGVLGISRSMAPEDLKLDPVPPLAAIGLGVKETWFVVERTLSYLGGVVVGRESADQLGGPIRIAQVSGQVATGGIVPLVHLAAVLSVSIGLLNLFPIPLLDGGHLLFYAIEAIRGRPLSERAQEFGFRIGLTLVLMLMIFATFNDIVHLASRLT
ncbi:MAG: metalloprotease RseP [Xanthobacteraceae bacterium]|jgi:regulator of sigma E protease|nr:metalloprotease RseP [Xanthobacteraceae bacterium]